VSAFPFAVSLQNLVVCPNVVSFQLIVALAPLSFFFFSDEFDDEFIDHLFELVETTRDQQDEDLNYAVIKLIVRPAVVLQGPPVLVR
jgi:hypothetical protein